MSLGRIVTTKGLRSLSRLRGRAGVGVSPHEALSKWRDPHPPRSGAQLRCRARRPKSELRSSRPPQAGEVRGVRRTGDFERDDQASWNDFLLATAALG